MTAGAALVALTASAQVNVKGDSGIDTSGNTAQEGGWRRVSATGVARVDCLKEADAVQAEKRRGTLCANSRDFAANAFERCKVFDGADRVACQARVVGYGSASGSVVSGAVIEQIETVELPSRLADLVIEPASKRGRPAAR